MPHIVPRPWVIDARNNEAGIAGVFLRGSEALKFETDEDKNFVVGAKGMGKSLLLQKKYLYLVSTITDKTNHVFLPGGGDKIELMSRVAFSFSNRSMRDRAHMLDSPDWWELVWSVAIAAVVVYHVVEKHVVSDIWQVLGMPEDMRRRPLTTRTPLYVHKAVQALVKAQIGADELAVMFSQLRPALGKMDKTVVVFLDNVDEAFQPAALDPNSKADQADSTPVSVAQDTDDDEDDEDADADEYERLGPEFSLTAQVGLLAAVRVLRGCKSLRIYASLRIEALDKRATHAMWQQERALCVELTCTKEFAREIFEANIDATPDKDCARPEVGDDRYVRFIGFSSMPFLTEAGEPESMFDFFYRHTLGRPRDLMELGAELVKIEARERTLDQVRTTALRCAGKCLKAYEGAILPVWDPRWESAFGEFDTNVLSEGDIVAISARIELRLQIRDPITYLVDRGLLGTVKGSEGTGKRSIHFREPSRYIRKGTVNYGHSPYYFLHPVVLGAVRKANQSFRIDRATVVGPDSPFNRPIDEPVLRIDGLAHSGLTVLIDSRTVLALRNEGSISPPVFAAIASAVWRLGRPTIEFASFAKELKRILHSRVCTAKIHGRPLEEVVDDWIRDDDLRIDIEDVVADLNWIVSKHMRDKTLRDDYLRWDGVSFTLALDGKVDCSLLASEVERLCPPSA